MSLDHNGLVTSPLPLTPFLSFEVYAEPTESGSKTAGKTKNGTAYVRGRNPKRERSWRNAVILAARYAMMEHDIEEPADGPLRVDIQFRIPRPPSVKRRYPSVKPDADKLLRNTLDGLTQAGVIVDDSRIVDVVVRKRYADGVEAGAWLLVSLLEPPEII